MALENQELNSDGTPVEWWFNTKTGAVESGRLSAAPYRIGPFKTADEARRAPEIVAERAKSWRTEEEAE